MSHDLEQDGEKTAFASRLVPAWHRLGTVFAEKITDYLKIMGIAHLAGWNVHLQEMTTQGTNGLISVPGFAVVRTNPFTGVLETLATVGDRYNPIQNEEAFAFTQHLMDGAEWETAGSIRGGKTIFGSLALEREVVLDPNGVSDIIKSYLLLTSTHDGSGHMEARVTPVRVVCQNTLNIAVRGAKSGHKIRHTVTAQDRLKVEHSEARAVLGLVDPYLDAFEKEAQALYAAPATQDQFVAAVEAMYPRPAADASKRANTEFDKRLESVTGAYQGPQGVGIHGTAWGVFNALTDSNQWDRRKRNTAGETDNSDENFGIAGAGLDGATNAFRNKALSVVKELILA